VPSGRGLRAAGPTAGGVRTWRAWPGRRSRPGRSRRPSSARPHGLGSPARRRRRTPWPSRRPRRRTCDRRPSWTPRGRQRSRWRLRLSEAVHPSSCSSFVRGVGGVCQPTLLAYALWRGRSRLSEERPGVSRGVPVKRLESARRVVLDDELDVTRDGNLGTLGATHEAGLQLVELDLEVARGLREHVHVATGGGDLERLGRLRALLHVDELARLHAERGAVDDLAVDEDVAVHDELAGLGRGAGEAGAQHERVEAHLEQLDEILTGQARLTTGLVEDDAQLLLADAVLLAQTLLLAQTHRVVAVGLALGAAVLAGSVGTLLEVAGGLRSERDAEGAGEADLATVLC